MRKKNNERPTMYIKNRRNSSKFKGCGLYQTLCLTETSVLRNRLLFIYKTVVHNAKKILQSLKSVLKKPTLGQAHLFFANAQSQRLKK
jgi:hypothetical protein